MNKNPTVTEIIADLPEPDDAGTIEIKAWLRTHGYDGLYCDDCGCACEELRPCGGDDPDECRAGYIRSVFGEWNIGPNP